VTFPSLTLEKTPLRSTAGVLFEQGEGGVNVSVPVTTEARIIRNIDESAYSGEIGPFLMLLPPRSSMIAMMKVYMTRNLKLLLLLP
jgi:hypothetical protein